MDPITISTMEVLETKPLTELVSEATIKVCYVSDEPTRNNTIITKAVGREIASTLPGAPVAGFFNKQSGDFEEHNRLVSFAAGELTIEDPTRPYGFVSPIDKPWYQDFVEGDKTRTYLMCKAYFWTRQYAEASLALNKGQSMELDEKSMCGYYTPGSDVFVFTSVTLDKLCILGDDFEPCFEGAKIMSTYCKQFDSLAEELEKTIGRRYYVMKDKLIAKPEAVTLKYALELGWNLNDAIYVQLTERGAGDQYSIQGIFTEGGELFTILQDRETLEHVRCSITVTDQETVVLAPEMQAVVMSWTPKTPAEPAPVTPLSQNSTVVVPETEPVATVYTTEAPEPESAVIEPAIVEPTVAESAITEPVVAEPAIVEPAEPVVAESAATSPVTDFSAQLATFTAKFAALEAQIAEKDATLAKYKAVEQQAMAAEKNQLVAYYAKMLDSDEMAPVLEKIAEYSTDTLETKLALMYTRKQRNATNTGTVQVDISSMTAPAAVPDFIRQAQEYDKTHDLYLV